MTERLDTKLTTEVATVKKDPYNLLFNNLLRSNDSTLASRGGAAGLRLYDEIERDCHAFSVLQKRKLALISRPVIVEAASQSLRDRKARDAVNDLINSLPFDLICLNLLDATLKGFSVAEIVWGVADGFIKPLQILPKDQRRFTFDAEYQLRLLTRTNLISGEETLPKKFIVHSVGAKDGNPFGIGLGTRLFWPVFFKRQGIQFWLTFADKFGSPTAVGKYPNTATQKDKKDLLDALGALANDTGVTIPENMVIELLEAARNGKGDTYETLCRYMDEEISKAVLGETLSTTMGKSGGSYAASNTHNEVRLELTKADADLLSDTLNATLIKWFCEFNFPDAKPPRVKRDFSEPADIGEKAATDKTVFDMGFKPTLKYIRETYGDGWEEAAAPSTADQQPAAQTGAGQDGATASFSETTLPPAQQVIVNGAVALSQDYETLLKGRVDSLLALLDETKDLALFSERLQELIADTAMDQVQSVLENSRISASLLGKL
jgi:phage gp29-like protein